MTLKKHQLFFLTVALLLVKMSHEKLTSFDVPSEAVPEENYDDELEGEGDSTEKESDDVRLTEVDIRKQFCSDEGQYNNNRKT